MPFLTIVILALVQGITEFLPISSSGHLVLAHSALDGDLEPQAWADSLMIDVAVHVGTLFSVLIYFRDDVRRMVQGGRDFATGAVRSLDSKLMIYVVVSSLPVIFFGFILHQFNFSWLRSVEVVAWATLIFGALLWAADRYQPAQRSVEDMTFKDAFFIGLAQALALIPGTSRSGITMIASRYLGYTRSESARYSLLLAIIAIAGAGTLAGLDLVQSGNVRLGLDALLAAVIAFGAGWVAIALMMRWLERFSFAPFAIYRVILGVVLLGAIYSGYIA